MRTRRTFGALLLLLVVSPLATSAQQGTLEPRKGEEIGAVYEAFLSPHQEPGEEEDTPRTTPKQFRSTAPSQPRSERRARAHGVVRFTKDFSKAYVEVRVENLDVKQVSGFHIHCGKPDLLGPILVDFAHTGDIQKNLSDGVFSAEITNEHIKNTAEGGHGVTGALLIGCPVVAGMSDKVKTIAGMEHIARQGELYFNLHTYGQVYFGYMRGMLRPQGQPAR